MAELKDPKEFPKALALLQSIDMTLYIVAAVVIYRYTGVDVASPALGSAGPLISRISYGIALPTVSLPSFILHNSDPYFRRLSLLESSTVMLQPNHFTSASLLARTGCTKEIGSLRAPGSGSHLSFGSSHGSSPKQSLFSTIFSA